MSYIAPHTFYYCGGDASQMPAMLKEAAPILHHVRVADTLNPFVSSGQRYVANPPDDRIRVHQHSDIGQGEIDWEIFFETLAEVKFDGIYSSCVFGWEDRAEESSRFMSQEIRRYIKKYYKS
jgi:myo-inositol catabolism protein IolH